MNKKYILVLILIILLLIIGIFIIVSNKEKTEITNIKSFHSSYINGYGINNETIYEIRYDEVNKNYIARIRPNGIPEVETKEVKVDNDFVNKVKDILVKYHVEEWNGFNKSNLNVLDGNSFKFNVVMDDDNEIEASGYMMWPNNYKDVLTELNNIFMEIYNK